MTNFYVPIEIKSRDFYGRLLLSLRVCKDFGWNVYFGFRGDVNYFAKNFEPGIYYGLATIRNFEILYDEIKNNGNLITISDEEGLVTYSEKYYVSFKISKKILKLSDAIFTWGEKNKKILDDQAPENINKFFALGNPRLDLLKKPFNSIYANEINIIKKKYGKFFLICTNFSYTNYYDKNIKYSDLLKKRKFFKSDADIKEWKKYEKIKESIFDELRLFLKNSNKIKNVKFIIRCHPSENFDVYKKFEEQYENVFFDNSFSAHPWILASEGIINHYCTTTYEGLVANKNIYTIKPNYATVMEDNDFFKSTFIAKSYGELINFLSDKNKKRFITDNGTYCSENLKENYLSHKFIAAELGKLQLKNLKYQKKSFFITRYKLLKILHFFKDLILMRKNEYIDHKIKNIKKNEIEEFINQNPDFKNNIKVDKICKNFFRLSNENY